MTLTETEELFNLIEEEFLSSNNIGLCITIALAYSKFKKDQSVRNRLFGPPPRVDFNELFNPREGIYGVFWLNFGFSIETYNRRVTALVLFELLTYEYKLYKKW